LTFNEGLELLLCLGWYPPFVQRSGPPFVGPASVSLAGALVVNLLLAGSMRGMGSTGRLVPQVVPPCGLILLETT
jgi:hypothetical protein